MASHWTSLCFPVLVVLILLNGVSSEPSGAPQEACDNMRPNHQSFGPSLQPPPFTIIVASDKFIVEDYFKG